MTSRLRKRLRVVLIASAVAVVAWMPVAYIASNLLVVRKQLSSADAILVLGGGGEYKERVRHAAMLYVAGIAPRILLTNDGVPAGYSEQLDRNPLFIERARHELERIGVPGGAITELPTVVGSTRDEAEVVAEAAREMGLKTILIVTSPYHTRRALWTFETVAGPKGVEFGISSPTNEYRTPPDFDWWLSRRGWKKVSSEYLKFAYYLFSS